MVSSVNLLPIRKNHSEFTDYQDLNMALKQLFVLCSAMAACAIAGVVPVAPAAPVLAKLEDFDAAPQYSFAYDVQDATTGDSKAQYERREGDVVQGSYSLIEADGTRRIVDYTADPINGFNAVVSREPAIAVATPVVATPANVVAPVVAAPARIVSPAVAPARIVAPAVAPARIVAPAVAPARIVAPAVAPARLVAPAVAPARIVAPAVAAAPLVAKNVVASAPLLSGSVYAPAPFPYTLPRAVASRLSAPIVYASPYAAYTL